MQYKIIGIVVCLLITIGSFPLTANIISSNQKIEPEGKLFFTARSTGPCLIGWNDIATWGTSPFDGYLGPAKGFIIHFGTMPYHSQNGLFTNFLSEDNDEEVLWKVNEKTLLSITWQQEGVNHHLQIICTPQEETCGSFFINDTVYYFACPRGPGGVEPADYTSKGLAFTGVHRNGSKTEPISGYTVFGAFDGKQNFSSQWPEPVIMMWLIGGNMDTGELEFLHSVIFAKNGWDMSGTIIEKANSFHVNYWTL